MMKTKIIGLLLALISAISIANAQSPTPEILITEINHLVPTDQEWIEIQNLTNKTLEIKDLKLIENGTAHGIKHTHRTQILPKEIIILANKAEIVSKEINSNEQIFDTSWQSLNNSSEELAIAYQEEIYDQIIYPEITEQIESNTLQRIDTESFAYQPNTPLTYKENTNEEASPETSTNPLTYFALITEVSPNSDNDFIEVYINPLQTELNLKDWHISSTKELFTFPELILTEPQLLVISTDSTDLKLNSGLTATNETISLINSDNEILDTICWQNQNVPESKGKHLAELIEAQHWQDGCFNSESIEKENSIGRISYFDTNTNSDWQLFPHSTEGAINKEVNSPPHAIIEIQSGNLASSDKVTINLTGASSTDPDNDKLTYEWQLNETIFSEKANPNSLTIANLGHHTIKLTVTDNLGSSSTTQISALVYETPPPEIKDKIVEVIKTTPCLTPDTNTYQAPLEPTVAELPEWQELIITSFLPNPDGPDINQEWIQIKNTSNKTIDLNNWQLDDSEGGSKPYTIANKSIQPDETITFLNSETKINLNNNSDSVRLISPNGKIIAEGSYTNAQTDQVITPQNIKTATNKEAAKQEEAELKPTTTYLAQSTTTETSPSTSTHRNGDLSTAISFSEVYPNPQGTDSGKEWLEISNSSTNNVNLGNWQIQTKSKTYTLPDTITIASNSELAIPTSSLNLNLSNKDSDLQLIDHQKTQIDSLSYETSKEGLAYSLINNTINDVADWQWTEHLTPNYKNPKLISLTGTTNNDHLINNEISLQNDKGETHSVHFQKKQLTPEQLELIANQPQLISLEALETNNKLHLSKITDISPIKKSHQLTIISILPIIIVTILTIAASIHPVSRSWLKQKLNLN